MKHRKFGCDKDLPKGRQQQVPEDVQLKVLLKSEANQNCKYWAKEKLTVNVRSARAVSTGNYCLGKILKLHFFKGMLTGECHVDFLQFDSLLLQLLCFLILQFQIYRVIKLASTSWSY